MSVVFEGHVRQRTWRGYDDPGLPVGMWNAGGSVTGDASGGQMTVQFNFREGGNLSGRFFNLEQIEVFHSASAAKAMGMIATNWDTVFDVGLINRQWFARLENNSNTVSAMTTSQQYPLPIFLGITAPVSELPSIVSVTIDNVDVTSLVTTMQGYIWEPRSVLAQGGLRRPVDSLYGGGRQ